MIECHIKCDAPKCKSKQTYVAQMTGELPKGWIRLSAPDDRIPNQKLVMTGTGTHTCSEECAMHFVAKAIKGCCSIAFDLTF